jgi:hypothetical protein
MAHERFVNTTLSELQEANRSPIYGYQHLPVLTLEEATEKIILLAPGIVYHVSKAKQDCNRSSLLLTRDESAAIYLYSMPISFFSCLNEALRAEDRHALKPWLAFLKLFITALEKLPSIKKTVWRGVSGDVGSVFDDGYVHTWWSINSCSADLSVVKQYIHNTGTLFDIDASHGKDISEYSIFHTEKEIVLMPGTHLRAKHHSFNFEDRFFLVYLEEEKSQRLVYLKDSLGQLNECVKRYCSNEKRGESKKYCFA